MKTYKKIILAILLVSGIVVAGAVGPKITYRMVTGNYLVAASDSSSLAKLVAYKVCDGTADDVQWQACIAAAEATSEPSVVKVASGDYSFTNTIYIGYLDGRIEGTEGCSLIAEGKVEITYDGDTVQDCSQFLIQVAPSLFNINFRLEGFTLVCRNRINGVAVENINRGSIKDLQIQNSRYIGFLATDAWFGHYEQLSFISAKGMGAVFLRCHGAVIDRLIYGSTTPANMPEVWSYNYSDTSEGFSSTFEFLELLTSPGRDSAIFLGRMGQPNDERASRGLVAYITESHANPFLHGDRITGSTTSHWADIRINGDNEEYDCTSGIFITCNQFSMRPLALENLNSGSDPLLLVMANGGRIENVRFENTTSWPTSADPAKPAETLIELRECRNVVVQNVQGFAGNTISVPANAYQCDIDQSDQEITDMTPSTFGDRLQAGDSVYIWDGVGGMTDAIYTVSAADLTDTSFKVDEDPGADVTNNSVFVYAITNVERMSPATIVDMVECRGCVVRDLNYKGCRTSFVAIDSDCTNCVVDTPWDWYVEQATQDDEFWLATPHPTVPIANSGTRSQIRNLQLYDSGTIGTATYAGILDGVQELTETDGTTYKTTLILHKLSLAVTELAGDPDGRFSEKIYDFPEGRIVVTGVTINVTVDATSQYDVDGDIDDDASGAIALGTGADANGVIENTEEDLCPETAFTLASGVKAVPAALAATTTHFDGTGTAKDCYLNGIITGADSVDGATDIGVYGTVTITWTFLGDY